ncbi:hypothetical protein HMPREF0476_1311 [Kingella kingae ATCC 23330]|uniref:Uncharacterized protein n=1 Tax=Kingella kingae ATCC 23330 TaxID=887327 RepID=F5S7X8_KINKI|nr:hypothetical protein HMPREF0476_1311 [Kingella kingae ATCC 23330]
MQAAFFSAHDITPFLTEEEKSSLHFESTERKKCRKSTISSTD